MKERKGKNEDEGRDRGRRVVGGEVKKRREGGRSEF